VKPLVHAAIAGSLLAAGCGDDFRMPVPPAVASPVRVSGASPFAPGCGGPAARGTRYPDSEVEPHLAVDPANPDHLVAAWQQDRWSNGGADGLVAAASLDGGATWTATALPLSRCGGGAGSAADYDRATDPWVSISSSGIVHAVGLAVDATSARAAILATRSTDGGLTWEPARALAAEADGAVALDKPTLTADPTRPGMVYAVWDRLTGVGAADPATSTGPAWLARSTDDGQTWEPPRVLHDPGPDAQTIASQLLVQPDGAVVNVFVRIVGSSSTHPVSDVMAMRSGDGGSTWSGPVVVGALQAIGAVDPRDGHGIRAGEVVPSAAADAAGRLWVAWQDARFSGGVRDGIALASSGDRGLTWSGPVQANRDPLVQAFRPAVAAGPEGTVAVVYYDLRFHDALAHVEGTWAAAWRATTSDGGATWAEVPEGGPFDLRAAPDAGGWFLGDYTGLVARRGGFASVFSMSRSALGAGTDAFAAGAALPVAVPAARAQRNDRPAPLADRVRALRERPR
jgi:hypothetical protein